MNIIEKNVPKSVTAIINLLVLTLFIPILLYAVYQTVILVSQANEGKINIIVNAKIINNASVNKITIPQNKNNSVSNNKIVSLMNELTGVSLGTNGETDMIKVYAAKNENTFKVLAMNIALQGKSAKIVPLTIEGLTPGKYSMQLKYVLETGCAVNDPPADKPPRTINISGNIISTSTCLISGNSVLWKLTKL